MKAFYLFLALIAVATTMGISKYQPSMQWPTQPTDICAERHWTASDPAVKCLPDAPVK